MGRENLKRAGNAGPVFSLSLSPFSRHFSTEGASAEERGSGGKEVWNLPTGVGLFVVLFQIK